MENSKGLNKAQQFSKRLFDLVVSILGVSALFVPIIILIIFATISTRRFGLFWQNRIGKNGKAFLIFKVRSMIDVVDIDDCFITVKNDDRITRFGSFLRKFKLDELPQIFNVLIGDMSIVGPRPDVKGYADKLKGYERIILSVRPGITGPATLKFKDEETLLVSKEQPKEYNDKVIWPKKVKINIQYIENWSLLTDIKYIFKTVFSK